MSRNSSVPGIPTRALDGARVVWRHWQRPTATACEGFIREFSADERMVRISTTDMVSDAGDWHVARDLRVEAVLDTAKQPMPSKRRRKGAQGEEGDE